MLTKSAQAKAERIGRKMLKLLEEDAANGVHVYHESIVDLSYDMIEWKSDTDKAHARWLDMRTVAEGIVLDAHPEWDEETVPYVAPIVPTVWDDDIEEIISAPTW